MPIADLALMQRGYHIGYTEIKDLLVAETALDLVDEFYSRVQMQWRLAGKVAMETCSRGGLAASRYAARHPERIDCLWECPNNGLQEQALLKTNGKVNRVARDSCFLRV